MIRVLYADPSWSFHDKGSRIAPDSTRTDGDVSPAGYPTMSTDDIAALPVREVTAPDSVLFLWTTHTHLLGGDAARVCDAWGYTPKVCVPWVKVSVSRSASRASYREHPAVALLFERGIKLRIGGGHYVRGCTEQLIIATRGSMVPPSSRRLPGVIVAPRGRHSAKPPEARALIETLYPASGYPQRAELFARERVEGWRSWGNEINSDDVFGGAA